MSEIRVHIERLVVDGTGLSSLDASAVQASLSSAVEQHLEYGLRDRTHRAEITDGAYASVRTPAIAAASEGPVIGHRAGAALAMAIAPLCLGSTQSRGSGRG